MKKNRILVAALFFSSQLSAQTPLLTQQADSSALQLEEVVCTANKYARKQSETGKVLHLVTRDQLERSGARSLGEILNDVTGTFLVGAQSNPGTNITTSIRGASAGNVLILLDGIPVNDPSVITNYYDLNLVPAAGVERIEILKGGQSTLYGSDAVAGVINIITRKATNKKAEVNGMFSGGSYNNLQQSLGLTGKYGRGDYRFQYTHLSTDGFSAASDSTGQNNFDRDGMNQHAFDGQLGLNLFTSLRISLQGAYSRYKNNLDAAAFTDDKDFSATNDNRRWGAAMVYTHRNGAITFNYQFNRTVRAYLDDSVYQSNPYAVFTSSAYTGRTRFAELYANWLAGNWEWLAGADYRGHETEQWYYSTGPFGPYAPPALAASIQQISPYASVIYKMKNGQVEAGGRWNHHSVYGNNASFSFNPTFLLNNRFRFYTNVYSAFKTPTLYQLYDGFAGNASLRPERSRIAEAGVATAGRTDRQGRLTFFYRHSQDAIIYTYDPSSFNGRYLNAGKQVNYGLELEAGGQWKKVRLDLSYTYTDGSTTAAYDGTGSPTAKDTSYYNLYRIPRHRIMAKAAGQWNRHWYTRIQVQGNSSREEFIYGERPETLRGYIVADLDVEYSMGTAAKIFLSLRNLTGTRYTEIRGFNTRGFNFSTGIRFRLP